MVLCEELDYNQLYTHENKTFNILRVVETPLLLHKITGHSL